MYIDWFSVNIIINFIWDNEISNGEDKSREEVIFSNVKVDRVRETEAPGWDERDDTENWSCDGNGEAKFEMENVEN